MDAPRHKQSKQRHHVSAEGASVPSAALPSLSATSKARPSAPTLQGSLGQLAPAVTQPGVSLAEEQQHEEEEEEEEGSLLGGQQEGDELGTQQEGLQPVAPIGALPATAGGPSSGLPERLQQEGEAGLSPAAGHHPSSGLPNGVPQQQQQQGEGASLSPVARPAAAGPFFPSGRHSSRGPPATAERVGRASARLGRVPQQMQQLQVTLEDLVRAWRGSSEL